MFVSKKKIINILARELAVQQLGYNRWSDSDSDIGFEVCNNYANRMQGILAVATALGIEKRVIELSDEIVAGMSSHMDDVRERIGS